MHGVEIDQDFRIPRGFVDLAAQKIEFGIVNEKNRKMFSHQLKRLSAATKAMPGNGQMLRFLSSGERKTVTLIPGDGIGPEIAAAVQRLLLSTFLVESLFGGSTYPVGKKSTPLAILDPAIG